MRAKPAVTLILLLTLALPLAGCGGGGGSDSGPAYFPGLQATVVPLASWDGIARGDGSSATTGGLVVGDQASTTVGTGSRGLLRFDLNRLPPTATITSVILRVYQAEVRGNPYNDLGAVHVRPADLGDAIDSWDYNSGGATPDYGQLSANATIGYKSIDLTARLGPGFVQGAGNFDLALWINGNTANLDGQADQAVFEDADDSLQSGNPPQLIISWTMP